MENPSQDKVVIIIPTYNEKENIRDIIPAVLEQNPRFEILIVDDSSPDGTGKIVQQLIPEFQGRLHLEVRTEKSGLGTAYIHGFNWALKHGYSYIFEMDADFSHPPKRLNALLEACENGAGISIGSRYISGGGVIDWPMDRVLMSKGASIYVQLVTGMPIKDPTAGFKCYRRETLEAIQLSEVRFIGYAFQIEMKYRAYKKGYNIVEVPILFRDREKGKSKMSMKIFKEAFFGVWKLRRLIKKAS